jgi:hypothetical protein
MTFYENYLLSDIAKCMRCQKPAIATLLEKTDEAVIAGYVCADNHVSRVVYFANNPNKALFEEFLRNQLGECVRSRDIRKATRHGWELSGAAEKEIPNDLIQLYWTFYAKNDEEKNLTTYLCQQQNGGCGRLFTQSGSQRIMLCPTCSKTT